MITAFGMAHETGDGGIAIRDDAVRGVHLTRLKPDGTDRERGDRAKIMIGHSVGSPLVMSPPGNVGGLAITEGVEDALTLVEAVGVGAWAAGSASRLPSLADAMPSYVSSVTVVIDDDADGWRHATTLINRIRARRIEVRKIVPNRWRPNIMQSDDLMWPPCKRTSARPLSEMTSSAAELPWFHAVPQGAAHARKCPWSLDNHYPVDGG
jgi:hypothetical protein